METENFRRAKWLFIGAAALSMAASVVFWFAGDRERSLFVGLWVPSILSLGALVFAGRMRS